MRLTVRTMLAWIDGVLTPSDQAALGEKVAASDVAGRLVERTKAAVQNPGLSAPAPIGRGLADDANTVAEFLDNVLDDERLAAFERVCVESDRHLAEAASCHGMLAEILREPGAIAPVDPRMRSRLIDRSKHPSADVVNVQPAAVAAPAARHRRRRRTRGAWGAAAAAVVLLVALVAALVWTLGVSGRRGGDRPGDRELAADATPIPAVGQDVENAMVEPVRDAPVEVPSAEPALPSTHDDHGESLAGDAREPDRSSSAVSPDASTMAGSRPVEQGEAMAIVAVPMQPEPSETSVESAVEAPHAVADDGRADSIVTGEGGPLLHRRVRGDESAWASLSAGAVLADREQLLAPPWCLPVFIVDGVRIRLGPSTLAMLSHDADGTPRLEVVFGRAVVSSSSADARIGIVAGGLSGVLSGMLRNPAGVEVVLVRADGAATGHRTAAVIAGDGDMIWRQTTDTGAAIDQPLIGVRAETLLAAHASIEWSETDPAAAVITPPAATPSWFAASDHTPRVYGRAVESLATALAEHDDGAIEIALHAMAGDRRVENRMIAAATLAMLGDYRDLVAVLGAEGPDELSEAQWTDLEAAAVPLALARGENAAAALAEAFRAAWPEATGEVLALLARGMSDEMLESGGDRTLIEALSDGHVAVRRYAIRRLVEIAPPDDRHRGIYRADRPEAMRRDGVAWWASQRERGRIRRGELEPKE